MREIYLLTGATGFLGGHLVRLLTEQGRDVRALVRAGNAAAKNLPKGVEVAVGDLLDTASLDAFFDTGDRDTVVIHCASRVALNPAPDPDVYAANVIGTRNLLERAVARRVKKFVYISSTSAIPEKPLGQAIEEVGFFDPKAVIGYYAKTKAEATQLVLDAVRQQGLNACVVFPSGIIGPNDATGGLLQTALPLIYKGRIPCGVKGSFNAVDVRDLAEGIIACADKGRAGEGYIMSNSITDMRAFFRAITDHAGIREVKVFLPMAPVKAVAFVVETVARLRRKPTILTRFTLYNLERNNDFSNKKAEQELGFRTRPFEETIRDTLLWLETLNS